MIWRLRKGKIGNKGFGSDGGYERERRGIVEQRLRLRPAKWVALRLVRQKVTVSLTDQQKGGRRREEGGIGFRWDCWDWVSVGADWKGRMQSSYEEDGG
ncbi:hypothetical protein ACFX11_003881 [Malus domestica]